MLDKTIISGTLWDFVGTESLAHNQRWVLSAMNKYGQELITMLWRILGNEQDVCDAYQDVFLQLSHNHRSEKRSIGDFQAAVNSFWLLFCSISEQYQLYRAVFTGFLFKV